MMPDKRVPLRGAKTDAPITEDAVALALMHERGDDIRWCPEHKSWFVWNGKRWATEHPGEVFEMARQVCRGVTAATGKERWGAHRTVSSVERFAHTQRELVTPASAWDVDPWLIGTPSGIVDLRDGLFRPARRSELIAKSVAADPAEEGTPAPLWQSFLRDTTDGDADLVRYLQRICGYALTGSVKEHALYFVYGPGGNGKGTFLDTFRKIMGDYQRNAQVETFMAGSRGRHPTELAALHGARLVTSSETEKGEAWAEAKIKALTGGDPITARFMNKDFFTFDPAFKLFIIGNHRPVLHDVDAALRRRLRMIPFKVNPQVDDKELREKLAGEFPAILRWMIDGCLRGTRRDRPVDAGLLRGRQAQLAP
jgi:putative DNA primase/helicase